MLGVLHNLNSTDHSKEAHFTSSLTIAFLILKTTETVSRTYEECKKSNHECL